MDQEKLKAQYEAVKAGAEVIFDSDEEANAVQSMLQADSAAPKTQMVGGLTFTPEKKLAPHLEVDPFMQGMKPAVMDYAPMVGAGLETSNLSKIKSQLSPQEYQMFISGVSAMPDAVRNEVLRALASQQWQRDVNQNKTERSQAMREAPGSYMAGQAVAGVPLAAAGGAMLGPEIAGTAAGQGLIGAGTGFIQNADAKSALIGGAAGAGLAKATNAIPNMLRAGASKASAPGAGNDMIASGLGYSEPEQTAMKATDAYWARVKQVASAIPDHPNAEELAIDALAESGIFPPDSIGMQDMADVARQHISFPYGAQAGVDSIQQPAIARGARGTSMNPLGEPPTRGVRATMDPIPVQQGQELHPKSWQKPGPGREIDLSWPRSQPTNADDATLLAANGEPSMWEGMSNQDMQNLAPTHPYASKFGPAQARQSIAPPSEEEVILQMLQPESPPLSPAERSVSGKLSNLVGQGQGLDNSKGFQFVKPQSALSNAAIKRGPLAIGISAPQKAEKMLNMLNSDTFKTGMGAGQAGTAKLMSLIADVKSSDEPELLDYLYKEMYPEYNIMSLTADKEQKHE